MKKFKILHISDMHLRHNGRLFYSTGKKINNGLILNGHNVLQLSDRDITNQTKNIFDIGGKKYLLNRIIKTIENFNPDLILFGHVDRLDEDNFLSLKEKYNSIKFSQWFLDPLNIKGPDFIKNKKRFFMKYQFCDSNFITTSPDVLDFVDSTKTYFIPNPVDPSIDILKNFQNKTTYDVFIAISHGQHRGILRKHFTDDRVKIIKNLSNKATFNIFGYKKNPVWGQTFFDEISKCSMGINLSRGLPIKHYSSDRISSLLGNGLLTFIHENYKYSDFMNKNEIVTYKNIKDLNKKILFFKNNKKRLRIIARNGHRKAHQIFNNKLIADFIVKKTFNIKTNSKFKWMNG